jgi:endonuclease YncB( thermonuclease family)
MGVDVNRRTWMALATGLVWGAFIALAIQSCVRGADYEIIVRSVYDGDTITADIALPASEVRALNKRLAVTVTMLGERIRLAGINTAELNTAEGKRVRGELAAMLPPGTRGTLRTTGRELEKYGRAFGRLIIGGEDICERMVRAGLAKPWDGKGARP